MDNSLISGTCEDRFQPVADEFQRNFTDRNEIGASLAVFHEGRLVLDLWGGHRDPCRQSSWERDTLVNLFSTTKMVTALCLLHLADCGQIDLDSPVCHYWPNFASNGKDNILVRHVLSHTAGLPGFTPKVQFAELLDWEKVIRLLEAERPWWQPGTKIGYHPLTYGYLLGEVVRQVTGKTLGCYLHDEICGPLGIDFYIGLPASEEHRVSEIIPEQDKVNPSLIALVKLAFPISRKVMGNPQFGGKDFNSRVCRAAEIPAANGMGNARSVAQLGSILAGEGKFNGHQVLTRSMVQFAVKEHARGKDVVKFGFPTACGLGVFLHNPQILPGRYSFFASGLGGSVCVMDMEKNVTIAYVMNRMAEFKEGDRRSIPLIESLWKCLS